MSYKTQMEAARLGIVTPQMRRSPRNDGGGYPPPAAGSRQGCHSLQPAAHRLDPHGIGDGLRTKINVNLGISGDRLDFDLSWLRPAGHGAWRGSHHGPERFAHRNLPPATHRHRHRRLGTVPV